MCIRDSCNCRRWGWEHEVVGWYKRDVSQFYQNMGNVYARITNNKLSPPELPGIKGKSWLKLFGITFHEDATNWDIHIDNMLSKANSRMYVLRVCKSYGYSKVELNNSRVHDVCIFVWDRSLGCSLSAKISTQNPQVSYEGPQVWLCHKEYNYTWL